MLTQPAIQNAAKAPVRGRRRRLGAWLVVGWLTYWFAAVAQACCISLSAGPESSGRTPAFHTGEAATHSFGSPTLPSFPDIDCDALGAIAPGATNTAVAGMDRIDVPDVAPLALEHVRTGNHNRVVIASDPLHPPASGVPLYLRNQRLLI